MLNIQNLSIQFSQNYLFREVGFMINKKDKIGLVGKNGAGKSTLLKFIAGVQPADSGQINKDKSVTIGYLPQEMNHAENISIIDEAKKAFAEIEQINNSINTINAQLAERTDYESEAYHKLIEELTELNDRIHVLGGDQIQEKIERVLKGLGFTNDDFYKNMSEFSGGWKMRVELAKILLQEPSLMLLDEPTNHLDIESIQWLEEFLKGYPGGILLISHDKLFLDNITNRTIEINAAKVYDYKAPYSKYLKLREESLATQEQQYKQQQKEIANTEQLIEKFRYKKNKAAFAQSLIKKLDKMDRIELDDVDNSSMNISFPPAPRSGKVVAQADGIKKAFGEKEVLKGVDFIIGRQEKVALLGKNGAGKSTLLKILMKELSCDISIELGHNVEVGYFAQDQAKTLDPHKTVFETIDDEAKGEVRKQVRSILGSFLFSGEDVDKKVSVLSGGEKGRLALCKLLLQPYNFLIFDEPTNHLDIRSKEVLKQALLNYDGTLLIVSHDRDFLAGLTDRVYEVVDGKLKIHHGDVADFLKYKKDSQVQEIQTKKKVVVEVSENKLSYEEQKQLDRDKRKLNNRINKLEKRIDELETTLSKMDEELANIDYNDTELSSKKLAEYNELKKELDQTMEDWETAQFELEELR